MTYCCGILVRDGLVMIADTRTNAGLDNISVFRKLHTYALPGERVMAIASSGNLSLSQSVLSILHEGFENPESGERETLLNAPTMFQAAQRIGRAIRAVHVNDEPALQAADVKFDISLLFGGDTQQITLVVRPRSDQTNPSRVLRNSATLSLGSVADGNPANDSRTAELTVLSSPIDLLVNKVDAVDPVPFVEGSTFIDYRVRVTNNGPTAGTAVRITENTAPPAGKRIRFVCDTTGFASSSCNATSLCSATNLVSGVGAALPAFTCSVPADDGSTTGPTVGNLANGATKDIFLRYEVLDNPNILVEIADWASADVRAAAMQEAMATGAYAPLEDLLAAPFRATVIRQMS